MTLQKISSSEFNRKFVGCARQRDWQRYIQFIPGFQDILPLIIKLDRTNN